MQRLLLLLLAVLFAGCAERVPLATIRVHVDLDKPAYKTLVERAGRSSVDVGVGAGAAFSSGGGRSMGVGVGFSIPLSTEVRLVGLDRENLDTVSFAESVKWGSNDLVIKVYHRQVMVLLDGDGPGGRLRRHVGDLDVSALAPGGYELHLTSPDAPLQLVPAAPHP